MELPPTVTLPVLEAKFWNASLLEPVELLLADTLASEANCTEVPVIEISGLEDTGPVAMAVEAMALKAMKARVFMTDPSMMVVDTVCIAANLRCSGMDSSVWLSLPLRSDGASSLPGVSVCAPSPIQIRGLATPYGGALFHVKRLEALWVARMNRP